MVSLEQYKRLLDGVSERVAKAANERVIVVAATKTLSAINRRIVRKGLKSDGTSIGTYSEKPIYVPKNKFVKKAAFKGRGQKGFVGQRLVKTGKKQYKVVKTTPKTMFLEKGYKELRGIQGRETGFVNLEYTGSMLNDFKVGTAGKAVAIGFSSKDEIKKRKGLEKRYGDIFEMTDEEKKIYSDEVVKETEFLVREILKG